MRGLIAGVMATAGLAVAGRAKGGGVAALVRELKHTNCPSLQHNHGGPALRALRPRAYRPVASALHNTWTNNT